MALRIRKCDYGRYCTVRFDDTGRQDGIVLSRERDNWYYVWLFSDRRLEYVDVGQILELREHVKPE